MNGVCSEELQTNIVRLKMTKKLSQLTFLTLGMLVMTGCEKEDKAEKDPQVFNGLVAYYTFDKGTCENQVGTLYHGLLAGGEYISDTPNGEGQALSFSEGGRVSLGGNPISGARNYTISLWLKDFQDGVIYNTLYDQGHGGPTFVWQKSRTSLGYRFGNNNGTVDFFVNLVDQTKGRWAMLTIVTSDIDKDYPGRHTLYLNGQQVGVKEDPWDCYASTGTATLGGLIYHFGNDSKSVFLSYRTEGYPSQPFKADNLRLYNKALSASEVTTLYQYELQKQKEKSANAK